MNVFRKYVKEEFETLHVFRNLITIDQNLKTAWETLRYIKVLRIPEKNISIYIHPDQTIHVIINQ